MSLPEAKELLATAGNTKLPVILVGDYNTVASDPTDPSFVVYQKSDQLPVSPMPGARSVRASPVTVAAKRPICTTQPRR